MKGVLIGHYTDEKNNTGATVIIPKNGAVGGVDVRGSAPGTRETDLLKGCKAVDKVNAICLTGGSAFGLEACDGVMEYLSEKKIGYNVGTRVVPIVCGAVLYDLDYSNGCFPKKADGYEACKNASETYSTGSVGAGKGATVGKVLGMNFSSKGGVGIFEEKIGNVTIGAIVVANSFGDIIDIENNKKIVAGAKMNGEFINTTKFILSAAASGNKGGNTTLGCVFTDAKLNREQANKLAELAQNGLALSISPVHTMFDGDTVFVLGCGEVDVNFDLLTVAVPEIVRKAVLNSVSN